MMNILKNFKQKFILDSLNYKLVFISDVPASNTKKESNQQKLSEDSEKKIFTANDALET